MKKTLTILFIALCGIAIAAPVHSILAARNAPLIAEGTPYSHELEYLTMTTLSQYVDTKTFSTSTTEVDFKVALAGPSGWKLGGIFGYFSSMNSAGNYGCVRNVDGYIRFFIGTQNHTVVVSSPFTVRMSMPESVCTVNSKTWTFTPLASVISQNLFIGTCRSPSENWNGTQTWYYCRIMNDGVLIRDFIPVIDTKGIVCFHDKVSKRNFYNAGTGEFIAGPIKE